MSTKRYGWFFVQSTQRMTPLTLQGACPTPPLWPAKAKQRKHTKKCGFWRKCKEKSGFLGKKRRFCRHKYHLMVEMVINSRFFEMGENFVQPAEIGTRNRGERALFGGFCPSKTVIAAFFGVCFCFLAYEYTKKRKIPFPKTEFLPRLSKTMGGKRHARSPLPGKNSKKRPKTAGAFGR